MTDVAIIDSGGANIASLVHALQRLGCSSLLTRDPERIRSAPRVILPGVGAAADAMARLGDRGLTALVPTLTQPVLGICLGIIPGVAHRLAPAPGRPVPHMGWNQLEIVRDCPLLRGVPAGAYAYFVHSYALPPGPETVATCEYGTHFAAAVSRGNFHGTQFHPERSAAVGSRILRNFLEEC